MLDIGYLLPPDPPQGPYYECDCGEAMIFSDDAWYCPNPFCCDDFLHISSYDLIGIPPEWEEEYERIEEEIRLSKDSESEL
jgi:hypothetical protein